MSEPLEDFAEPANLRLLRRLVIFLMLTMIAGFFILIALFAIRLSAPTTDVKIPSEITLPDGTTTSAFTMGDDWYAVVTTDDHILIYNKSDNSLRQTVTIKP